MHSADIKHWDAQARSGFVYTPDKQIDTWRSYATEASLGASWQGDCDDLVATVLDLLGQAGLPLTQRYRLEVGSKGSTTVNHLVGAVLSAEGQFWIVGDTFGSAYLAPEMRHTSIEYQCLSETEVIRAGAPWVLSSNNTNLTGDK